jgi:DNA-binding CsgD family transcriptional regulator
MPGLIRRVLALSLVLLGGWLIVYCIFPLYDPVFPITRDYSTALQGLVFAVIAVIAMRMPRLFNFEPLTVVALTITVVGVGAAWLGVERSSPWLMVASSTLLRISMSWVHIVVGVSLTGLGARRLGLAIVAAFLLSVIWQWLLFALPPLVGIALFTAIPFACYFLAVPLARPVFEHLSRAEPPFEVSVTRPASFLPFSSQLFICFLVFSVFKGFMISFGEVGGAPLPAMLFPGAFLVLGCLLVACKWRVDARRLFGAASLLVLAGLLLAPLVAMGGAAVDAHIIVNLLLSSGADCFNFLFWFLLATLAARNTHGAVPAFAWGSALSCFGIIAGASLGRLTDYLALAAPAGAVIVVAVMAWLFIAWERLFFGRFSFEEAIQMVEPESELGLAPDLGAEPGRNASHIDLGYIDRASARIAEAHALTPRESEILTLLVRGRSGRFIKEALCISENTVKAHVRHIYNKLDIHSHQSLIDMFEQQCERDGSLCEKA